MNQSTGSGGQANGSSTQSPIKERTRKAKVQRTTDAYAHRVSTAPPPNPSTRGRLFAWRPPHMPALPGWRRAVTNAAGAHPWSGAGVPAKEATWPILSCHGCPSAATATSRGLPLAGGPTAVTRWMMTRSTGQWLGAPVKRFPAGWTITPFTCERQEGACQAHGQ